MRFIFVNAFILILGISVSGCRKKVEHIEQKEENVFDLTEDKKALSESWIFTILKDPDRLVNLAKSNEGWQFYFQNRLEEAVIHFKNDLNNKESAIGLCRSTFELHQSYKLLSQIIGDLNEKFLLKQDSIKIDPDWINFIKNRNRYKTTKDKKAVDFNDKDGKIAQWFITIEQGQFLSENEDKSYEFSPYLPESSTDQYKIKLKIHFFILNNKLKQAHNLIKTLDLSKPDFIFKNGEKEVYLFDPGMITIKTDLIIYEIIKNHQLFDSLCVANAFIETKNLIEAEKHLSLYEKEILNEKNDLFARFVISKYLVKEDLALDVRNLKLMIKNETPKSDNIKKERIFSIITSNIYNHKLKTDFSFNRDVFLREFKDKVLLSGKDAPGFQDVNNLYLIERYIDHLQRIYAESFIISNQPEFSVKNRELAEEKGKMGEISGRNTLLSIIQIAYDNIYIGRLRIALKYLTRLSNDFPDANIPAELLRDLLTLKAIEQGNKSIGIGQ